MATIKAADAKITAKLIKDKIQQLEGSINEYSYSENPQIKDMAATMSIEKETLESVLQSLSGNHVNLKI